jgi:hypothetical protein
MPADVRWRFIGHLQSNKAKALCTGTPGLVAVETVDSTKLATLLDSAWAPQAAAQGARRLDVFVQVNTSGEETKHGVEPADAVPLARHVATACPHLRFSGLMTIGQPDYTSRPENFTTLAKCRDEARARSSDLPVHAHFFVASCAALTCVHVHSASHAARGQVCAALGLRPEEVELSMGMSGDFESAIEMGSTNVRVGSTIFGAAAQPGTAACACAADWQLRLEHRSVRCRREGLFAKVSSVALAALLAVALGLDGWRVPAGWTSA